jgi:hypothetical protein
MLLKFQQLKNYQYGKIVSGRMLTLKSGDGARHHLVEDVVRALKSLLGDDTGLLQKIYSQKRIINWCRTK